MNLYQKLRAMEQYLKGGNVIVFQTPYKKVRKIVAVEDGAIVYERNNGKRDKFDIDILYADYLLLKEVKVLTATDIANYNRKFKNGNKPCNTTTFMLLMEYFYGCRFESGKSGNPSIIYWI